MAKVIRTKSGALLDGAAIEALADEAERGYDLSKAKPQRVGRPSLGSNGVSPRLSFRTTPQLYQAARARARKEGRTVSELAREAVERYIVS